MAKEASEAPYLRLLIVVRSSGVACLSRDACSGS
jgi:hypothetical protein